MRAPADLFVAIDRANTELDVTAVHARDLRVGNDAAVHDRRSGVLHVDERAHGTLAAIEERLWLLDRTQSDVLTKNRVHEFVNTLPLFHSLKHRSVLLIYQARYKLIDVLDVQVFGNSPRIF